VDWTTISAVIGLIVDGATILHFLFPRTARFLRRFRRRDQVAILVAGTALMLPAVWKRVVTPGSVTLQTSVPSARPTIVVHPSSVGLDLGVPDPATRSELHQPGEEDTDTNPVNA
jgi:hypothetical protein